MSLPLEVTHPDRGVIVRQLMPFPFALIGRDERADLRLEGKEVSHRHAYLQLVAGRWWWVDLASRTGTHSANDPDSTMSRLDRQGIRIGTYIIRLAPLTQTFSPPNGEPSDEQESVVPVNPLTTESDDPSLLPRLALEFTGGMEGLRTWKMDRTLALIGRSSICKVRLHSPMVSRAHCAIVNTPSGLWFVDLLGREGTYVNGVSVRWGRLDPEDEMQIDQFRIRVRYLTPPKRAKVAMPHIQPANEEHGLTPRAKVEQLPSLPSLPSSSWQRQEDMENASAQVIAPVGLAVPMNGGETLLLPLVSQFSMMQQQMFEQFQQSLVMMAQMFGNLQREQMTLIRQELEQIQELTRQLHALPLEAARSASPTQSAIPQTPPAGTPSSPRPSVKSAPAAAKGETPPTPPKFAEGDVHAWLSQRLAALQQERQSRWQKVLSLISGR
jgi:pSer/pThr/pTyr-binding forkhead associated (FHA) protein